ncbi:M28 family peptidase [Qipengyuania sp. 1XM1-15A]|uniref:M28 family peptidase n=1 Tax=Qipengyuania xiamenensis TaxID=2867237 RepID=UPI001C88AA50|nr:M28 family peptidase [Qipengyuania xiamenensis]
MSWVDDIERKGASHKRFFLAMGALILSLLVFGFYWSTATPGESYSGPRAAPEDTQLPARLEKHVRLLAERPRNLEDLSSIERTTSYLAQELESYGYSVARQEVLSPADNLIVRIRPAWDGAPVLIIGAHYDSFGKAPGADDNASGVAGLLELARSLDALDGKSEIELQLVFYSNEEPPYFKTNAMGSLVHARSIEDPARVLGMISIESIGYFSDEAGSQDFPFPLSLRYPDTGNFVAFVGEWSSRDFLRDAIGGFREKARIASEGGAPPPLFRGTDWSDHWGYSEQGIPAIMVTDTAIFRNPHYHRQTDTADTLDYVRMALVVEGLRGWLADMGAPGS